MFTFLIKENLTKACQISKLTLYQVSNNISSVPVDQGRKSKNRSATKALSMMDSVLTTFMVFPIQTMRNDYYVDKD